jgi:hypothetical protein
MPVLEQGTCFIKLLKSLRLSILDDDLQVSGKIPFCTKRWYVDISIAKSKMIERAFLTNILFWYAMESMLKAKTKLMLYR